MMQAADATQKIKGALCLGEFGSLSDLSGDKSILEMIKKDFQSTNPDVRLASSICLGNITIGKPRFFLEQVFGMIQAAEPKERYLFLYSIREIAISKPECLKDQL